MEPDSSHSPCSSDPHARICGDDLYQSGFWTLAFGRLSLSTSSAISNSSSRSSSHAGVVPHSSSIREEFAQIDYLCDFLHRCTGRNASNTLEAITPSAEPSIPITVVPTLERDFNLETDVICLFLSKEGELLTESKKVQFRHLLIELFSGRGRHRFVHRDQREDAIELWVVGAVWTWQSSV